MGGHRRRWIFALAGSAAYCLHVKRVWHEYQSVRPPTTLAKYVAIRTLPLRSMSRAAGWLSEVPLPVWLRQPLFKCYSLVFACNTDECAALDTFPTFQAFFSRRLLDGSRRFDQNCLLTSPCDGVVLECGTVRPSSVNGETSEAGDFVLEPIKGVRYKMSDLIGQKVPRRRSSWFSPWAPSDTYLHYATIYLAPGDYHRFHCPCDVEVSGAEHIGGEKLPVVPWVVSKVFPGTFLLNQRAVIHGSARAGHLYIVPIGSLNVGCIEIDPQPGQHVKRGQTLGHFKMGSTIVLVFASSQPAKWASFPRHIKAGQPLLL